MLFGSIRVDCCHILPSSTNIKLLIKTSSSKKKKKHVKAKGAKKF